MQQCVPDDIDIKGTCQSAVAGYHDHKDLVDFLPFCQQGMQVAMPWLPGQMNQQLPGFFGIRTGSCHCRMERRT